MSLLNSLITKRPQHMTLEIQFLAWDRHINVAVIPVNGISIYVFDDNFLAKLTSTRMVHKRQVAKLKPLEINHAYSNSLFKKETKTNH